MANFLIAVGGTGQLVALAYHRLAGFLPWVGRADIYHMDMDTIVDFTRLVSDSTYINPLPSAVAQTFREHFHSPASAELCNDILDTLFTSREQSTDIKSGMYGRPPVGSSVIMDALNDKAAGLSGLPAHLNDGNTHTVVVCGSAVGGTGAGGVPTFAHHLHALLKQAGNRDKVKIYVFYFLKHFTLGEDDISTNRTITNRQIEVNSRSGMAYMQDRVAEGTDGCLLLGMDNAPKRNYQEVGSQEEAPQLLYLIAAMYAQQVFAGDEPFHGKGAYSAHAVNFEPRDGKIAVTNVGVKVPVSLGMSVELNELIQMNMAARDLLLRMARMLTGAPRFSFVPAVPRALRKLIRRVPEPTQAEQSREQVLSEAIRKISKRLDDHIGWYESFAKSDSRYALVPVEVADAVVAYKRKPMSFIRNWCGRLEATKSEKALSSDSLADMLLLALYRTLDAKVYHKTFFQ